MRGLDWAQTPVGPVEQWPQALKHVIQVMLTSRYAMWLAWGEQWTFFCNDAYKPTLGIKEKWALGAPATKVWAEIWKDIGPRAEAVVRTGDATWDEGLLLFLSRRGFPEETYHTFSYSPVFDDDGRIGGMLCVVTEDTERVIGARRLALLRDLATATATATTVEEACEKGVQAISQAPQEVPFSLVYLTDPSGNTARRAAQGGVVSDTTFAPELIRLERGASGWGLDLVAGSHRHLSVNVPEKLGELHAGPWPEPISHGVVLPLATSSGEDVPGGFFIVGCSPRRPFDAGTEQFAELLAGQLNNALAHANAYQAERQRVEKLAEIDRAKTTFFSNVSHEFRTPLTLMLGPLEAALQEGAALGGQDLEATHRNALRLLKLVNSLLDFARIEAGRVQASFQPVDFSTFTSDLASSFQSAIERAGLQFEVRCPPLPEPIYVDPDLWEKVVLNLVSNAFKFTFEGKISVRTRWTGTGAELTVEDSGTGISAEELPRLFERFHRVEGARSRSIEGSGVGLALVHELVKMHGGTIQVTSELGKGTRFQITLPAGARHLPAERVGGARTLASTSVGALAYVQDALMWERGTSGVSLANASAPLPASPRPDAGPRPRVLVADDNSDMREYLTRLLSGDYEVVAVGNGKTAVEEVLRQPVDLVISDVMMPELDGFGVIERLRQEWSTRLVPVVLLSARAGEEARTEGLTRGANDYITKPFSARELLARVAAQLEIARVREAERLSLESFLMQAPAAIGIMRGPNMRFELVNPRYWELMGKRDMKGKAFRDAFPELVDQGTPELFEKIYRTGEPFISREFPVELADASGQRVQRYFDWVGKPIYAQSGEVEGVMIFATEITERVLNRKRLEEAAVEREALLSRERAAREDAEAANRSKDEFLATVSHELRTPLTSVLGWAALLRQGLLSEEKRKRAVETIERNARTQAQLVEDLLDVGRILTGKLTLNVEQVNLSSLVEAAMDSVRPAAEAKGVRLQPLVDSSAVVMGDGTRLQQVLWNLLSNSVKFTPRGGRVQLLVERKNSAVEVTVADTGQGIAPEFLPHVFERFRQADGSSKREYGGLGLGLSIVKHVVEMHGGQVLAASDGAGRGATFTVRLPLAVSVRPVEEDVARLQEAQPRGSEAECPPHLAGLKVLVVDDETDTREYVQTLLENCQMKVVTASSVAAALQQVRATRPDLIVSDVGLPGEDGFSLVRQLRSLGREEGGWTPAVALTAYARPEDRKRCLLAGFRAHVAKPIDAGELLAVLGSLAPHREA